ncbi:MAG: prenyltransferase/squalene oxidase repeat-containing protein [Verrucomicrobiota bacterium]
MPNPLHLSRKNRTGRITIPYNPALFPPRFTLAAFLLSVCLLPLLVMPAGAQTGQEDLEHLAEINKLDEVDKAIDKGLRYLLSRQDATEGFFAGKLKNTYTGLGCIALMAAGHFPERSEFGEGLRRGINYLVEKSGEHNGYFGKEGKARMYGHAICTLALTEAYGMMPTKEENLAVKKAAQKAIDVILHSQVDNEEKKKHYGGWRYEPRKKDADLSVTVWQVLALRSAENCQMEVPAHSISNAVTYVRRVYSKKHGGYSYQPGKEPSIAMRCAGVVCMRALGKGKDDKDWKEISKFADFLMDLDPSRHRRHYFYQSYYVATAANMMGKEHRQKILPRLEKHLVGLQKDDGSFKNYHGYDGDCYSTAFSVICLSVRFQFLPIYQE